MPTPVIKLEFTNEELANLQTGVIVTGWRSLNTGSGKRKFAKEFSEEERTIIIEKILPMARSWYHKGLPLTHQMRLTTWHFLVRVCNYFGTL